MTDLDEDGPELHPQRMTWWMVAAWAATGITNMAKVVACQADGLSRLLVQHDMWRDERKDFADTVRLELEALPTAK